MQLPRNYDKVLAAGYRRDVDFRINTGNLGRLGECLVAAPHGGGIEPGTSEIALSTAKISGRAFYVFEGIRKSQNWQLHIDSTGFNEPTFLELAARSRFVLSVHGANGDSERVVYVGGLYHRGKMLVIEYLSADLELEGITVADAARVPGCAAIAGLSPQNLTNMGTRAQGVQLEFSDGARQILFPELYSREGRGRPSPSLDVLTAGIERALADLVTSRGT
jgi:phage replication-related protein YjqB (UPF0714/DUF867 family)